jgi:hypothetical protein
MALLVWVAVRGRRIDPDRHVCALAESLALFQFDRCGQPRGRQRDHVDDHPSAARRNALIVLALLRAIRESRAQGT